MLIEQSEAITTNMSKIARLKTRGGLVTHPNEYAPVATELNEVFGGEHLNMSWHWFIPLPVYFPEWAIDNIMGYEEPSGEEEDEDGIVGPYREPSVTDDGESNSITTRSSMGISSLMQGDDGAVGGGGANGSSGIHGLMAFDVEEGNKIQQQQQQHESSPHDDEKIITHMSAEGGRRPVGIKKRSNNSPPPLV
jgi:hypothetical protein